ncbi:MAG: orotidine-5'-phosphate decarboxylase [Bacteroidetes bacterium]|nr:orotidine-5'-phosphate decarboxylase [Bacteroidota bacterium]MBK7431248.1 orotidine-5'-phosphate decarboxylase [Bacteroidota bacterium]MBK7571363.1 orotidine-5'-phosphate decarboxylase [Bacteroidota bacterium]MBP9790541.1 orotidine-5'-phosphate decarboxylase [Bacteroidia bacterium]
MTRQQLYEQIQRKKSYLCVGLDTDLNKIPKHLLKLADPIYEFNRQIIDATSEYCVAFKPNLAFYEALGPDGLHSLKKTVDHISPDIFTIADAKRGDIGNTSEMYADAFFNYYNFDSVTVAPYMGKDSVVPFLKDGKWVILLALTSNSGSMDFQMMEVSSIDHSDTKLFQQVIRHARKWANEDSLMFVVGATHPELFKMIREIAPDNFLLVPGVGAQGGSLKELSETGMNSMCGLLVNSSRQIIYASSGEDFADKAREQAQYMQKEMHELLDRLL